jgi:outer membrane protein
MKGGQLIFNIVILALLAILIFLHFSDKRQKTTVLHDAATVATPRDTTGNYFRIAYFEMDSVTNSFAMVKEVKAELSREEDKINSQVSRLQKMFNDRLAQYQKQPMSAIQSEQANKEMLQLQESIRAQKQDMDQRYQDLYMRKMQEVKSRIEEFLKEYNKTKGYSYILGYEPGFIFYKDSTLNITGDLIKGLNDQYLKKK